MARIVTSERAPKNVRSSTISELGNAMAEAMMPLEPNNSNAAKYVNSPLFMRFHPLYIRACSLWVNWL